jgi:hypothetical protein
LILFLINEDWHCQRNPLAARKVNFLAGKESKYYLLTSGLSSLGVPGVPWHTQILADQLTLFQPGGQITAYAHLITTGTPGFSDLPTALVSTYSYLTNVLNIKYCLKKRILSSFSSNLRKKLSPSDFLQSETCSLISKMYQCIKNFLEPAMFCHLAVLI